MNSALRLAFLISCLVVVPALANGQSRVMTRRGDVDVVESSYSPRDLTDETLAVNMLFEEWEIHEVVRWDIAAILAVLAEQVYSDDNETVDYLLRGMGFTKWIALTCGSMATACVVDYQLTSEHRPTLVTYGQPLYADSVGAKWIDKVFHGRYARFVHGNDIVPSVPYYIPRYFPYAHAGNLIAISEDKLELANWTSVIPTMARSYCGSCGRTTMNARIEVYHSATEP